MRFPHKVPHKWPEPGPTDQGTDYFYHHFSSLLPSPYPIHSHSHILTTILAGFLISAPVIDFPPICVIIFQRSILLIQEGGGNENYVMCFAYAPIHLHTGLRTVPFPVKNDPLRLAEALRNTKTNFLVIEKTRRYPYFFPVEEERLRTIREAMPDELELVHTFKGGWIYKIRSKWSQR